MPIASRSERLGGFLSASGSHGQSRVPSGVSCASRDRLRRESRQNSQTEYEQKSSDEQWKHTGSMLQVFTSPIFLFRRVFLCHVPEFGSALCTKFAKGAKTLVLICRYTIRR